jgi:hypothetical protein
VTDDIVAAAVQLVGQARQDGIEIRLLGSVAVVLYCGAARGRPSPVKDVDVVTLRAGQRGLQALLSQLGWRISHELLLLSERRETYTNRNSQWTLDVFYDEIDGNHTVDVRDRFYESYPAIAVPDLILTKLQRQKMRQVDVWDCCELMKLSDRCESTHIVKVLCRDWGFFTTAMDNLELVGRSCADGARCAGALVTALRFGRKSVRWLLRATLGRRVKWWKEMYDTAVRVESE